MWLNMNKEVAYRKMLKCTNKEIPDKKCRQVFRYIGVTG
jgi:hypothetical protein